MGIVQARDVSRAPVGHADGAHSSWLVVDMRWAVPRRCSGGDELAEFGELLRQTIEAVQAKAGPQCGLLVHLVRPIRPEVSPIAVVKDHDGHLADTERVDDEVERFRVLICGDDFVIDLLAGEVTLRLLAVRARVFREYRDCHVYLSFVLSDPAGQRLAFAGMDFEGTLSKSCSRLGQGMLPPTSALYPPKRAEHVGYFTYIGTLMLVLFGVKNTLHIVENLLLALEVKQG